jgi:hypothetical protein
MVNRKKSRLDAKRAVNPTRKRNRKEAANRAKSAGGLGDTVTSHSLVFISERDAWYSYLLEMISAHKIAAKAKNPSIIFQAAVNVELAEAMAKTSTARAEAPNGKGRLKLRKTGINVASSPQVNAVTSLRGGAERVDEA